MAQSSETLEMFDNEDILKLCNIIPNEVLGLPSGGKEVHQSFTYFHPAFTLFKTQCKSNIIIVYFSMTPMLTTIQSMKIYLLIGLDAIQSREWIT